MARACSMTLNLLWIVITGCDAFVYLKCNDYSQGWLGHQSLLECIVIVSREAQDTRIDKVYWVKEQEDVTSMLQYDKGDLKSEPGFTFAEPHWKEQNLNVSMLVTSTAMAHAGRYKCVVNTNRGVCSSGTTLNISVPYGAPTISVHPSKDGNDQGIAMTLSCEATGGNPEGTILWYDQHNTDWTRSSKQTATKTLDGRFTLESQLDLFPGSIFPQYTCAVYNGRGDRDGEAQYTIPPSMAKNYEDPKEKSSLAAKIIIPVVTVGAVIIGLLLVRLLQRKSSHQPLSPNDNDYSEGTSNQFHAGGTMSGTA